MKDEGIGEYVTDQTTDRCLAARGGTADPNNNSLSRAGHGRGLEAHKADECDSAKNAPISTRRS